MAVYGYNTAQQMFSFMILYQSLVIICYILPVLDEQQQKKLKSIQI